MQVNAIKDGTVIDHIPAKKPIQSNHHSWTR